MTETCVAGLVWRPGEGAREGWVLHDGARVLDAGEGRPPVEPASRGFVMPSPVNAHTHVGDMVARGHDIAGLTLAQVVAPPDGLKHRVLRATPRARLVEGMRAALGEAHAGGARVVLDFREGGLDGVAMLREAAAGSPVRAVAFGRCAGAFSEEEAARVLEAADGYGLSALADAASDVPERAAALARRAGKRFALHLSEADREDAARAVALGPAFVVHCVRATRDDLKLLADARVPIVVCPRSNARFGPLPDVRAMLDASVTLALGSDNAMLQMLDVLDDARLLAQRGAPLDALMDALVVGGRVALDGRAPRSWLRKGDPADLVVLPRAPLP